MHIERDRVGKPKDLKSLNAHLLSPDNWPLTTDHRTHSFGTRLEPRYIFGAGFLLDQ